MNKLNTKNILITNSDDFQNQSLSNLGYNVVSTNIYQENILEQNYDIYIFNNLPENINLASLDIDKTIFISNDYNQIAKIIEFSSTQYLVKDLNNSYLSLLSPMIKNILNKSENILTQDNILKILLEQTPILISYLDNNNIIRMVRGKSLSNLKLKEEEILNKSIFSVFTDEKLKDKYEKLNSGKSFKGLIELKGVPFESWAMPLNNKEGKQIGSISLCTELSTLFKTEQKLEDSKNKYKLLIENSPIGIFTADKYGNILDANNVLLDILGSPSIEETKKINVLTTSYIIDSGFSTNFKRCLAEQNVIVSEMVYKSKWNKEIYIRYHLNCIYDNKKNVIGVQALIEDVTDRIRAQHKLETSLREKELLLKEIHHRVKNNLQIISSLLNLQTSYIKDKKTLEIFRESQNRVKSMALIHEELYKSSDLSKIDFKKYIENLITHLYQSYKFSSKTLEFNIISDKIFLDIETAIPLGLIINELVSNSVKYAFKDKDHGKIEIKLSLNDETFELIVSDDGIGLPKDFKFENQKTLGLQLVLSLIDQIDGNFVENSNNGTNFIITFQELKYRERY